MINSITRDVWDKYWIQDKNSILAKFFDKFVEFTMQFLAYPRVVAIIKRRVPSGKCLEAGCGEANISIFLAKDGKYSIVLTDISKEAILLAAKKFHNKNINLNTFQSDIYSLPLKNKVFDLALNFGVLEHLNNIVEAVRELNRISKIVVTTVPSAGLLWSFTIFLRKVIEKDSTVWIKETKLYTKEQMRVFFLKAGYNKVEVYASTLFGLPFLITVVGM
ncbi:MAG: class I SAM-dependent methyltransferase [Candidatus Omnitrophica bacterium]|nr:class I SAM-dependent methyltransferase [Candidatus Omnitrophota bacterium]